MNFMAPIPGMSLTREPGNSPWEQPPKYDTVEEALAYYLEKLDNEDLLDETLFALEMGYPVEAMVEFLTSHSVMEGLHSFDVKMLIAPVLHEYFVNLATSAGINFVETIGPSKEEKMSERDKRRAKALLLKNFDADSAPSISEDSLDKAEDMLEGEDEEDDMDEEEISSSAPLIKRRQ